MKKTKTLKKYEKISRMIFKEIIRLIQEQGKQSIASRKESNCYTLTSSLDYFEVYPMLNEFVYLPPNESEELYSLEKNVVRVIQRRTKNIARLDDLAMIYELLVNIKEKKQKKN